MPKEYRTTGETLTPLGVNLQQRGSDGKLANVNLTGRVVKVVVVNMHGNIVVAETETGVSVTSAAAGEVSYAIPSSLRGEHWIYFHAYGTGGNSSKYDIFPTAIPEENRMRVVIAEKA